MEAHARQGFWGDQLFLQCCLWCCFLLLFSTPIPFQVLGGTMPSEFLFTRAIDRRLWLRTERAAVMIVGLGPLILNLALSPLGPKLAFEPAPLGSPAALVQARYMQVLPGSHLTTADASGRTEQLLIRHGTEMFAAWLLWFGLVCMFLMAAYFSIVFTAWQRAGWRHSQSKLRPWLGAVMANAPAWSPIAVLVLCAALHINPLEASFLLFAGHPVLMAVALMVLMVGVQRLSERNIKKLEFETS
jgi:hypothetical protein